LWPIRRRSLLEKAGSGVSDIHSDSMALKNVYSRKKDQKKKKKVSWLRTRAPAVLQSTSRGGEAGEHSA